MAATFSPVKTLVKNRLDDDLKSKMADIWLVELPLPYHTFANIHLTVGKLGALITFSVLFENSLPVNKESAGVPRKPPANPEPVHNLPKQLPREGHEKLESARGRRQTEGLKAPLQLLLGTRHITLRNITDTKLLFTLISLPLLNKRQLGSCTSKTLALPWICSE